MNNPLIWCCGKDEFFVFDDVDQDWIGPFSTLEEAEEIAHESRHSLTSVQHQTLGPHKGLPKMMS